MGERVCPRINETWYFDFIPEENFRPTKPLLNLWSSQRIFPLLDPGIFKVSILPFPKYLGLPLVTHKQQGDWTKIRTLSKWYILVNDKLK